MKLFNMCDLHALCRAIVTTSIVEGFGLVYHEGWLSRKLVVGRKIPEIVRDFEANGMHFDHMYDRLAVSLEEVPRLRERLVKEYERKIEKLVGGHGRRAEGLTQSRLKNIIESKFFRIGNEDCVDFADLDVEMQYELISRLETEPGVASLLIGRNPALSATFSLLKDHDPELIEANRAVVCSTYSLNAMARRLANLFELGDSLYRKQCDCIPLERESHAAVIERYRTPASLRLLF